MDSLKSFYHSLESKSRLAILLGAVGIVLGTVIVLWWIFSSKQQLLFGNLREADAAEIAQSLNEWKIPHSFTDDGSGILVDGEQVHDTRMRLVSAGVPRGGHVGFELFDDNDFGVTEFAQRINYQRALQGEIERTIAAIPGVTDVRVHLAIKRPGLFLSRQEESKASVALNLEPGVELGRKQIGGIKSLVAAAVEGLAPEAVVVIGPGGTPLAGGASTAGQDISGQQEEGSLTATKLEQRVSDLLFTALGNRDSAVSVDVRLNFDRVHKTSERLLAQPGSTLGMVTKRQSSGTRVGEVGSPTGTPDEQVEYAHGTEREEITRASGTIERLSVAVMLPRVMAATELEQLRRLVGASVGLDASRGDRLEIVFAPSAKLPGAIQAASNEQRGSQRVQGSAEVPGGLVWQAWVGLSALAGLLIGLVLAWLFRGRSKAELSQQESEIVATKIRSWLLDEKSAP